MTSLLRWLPLALIALVAFWLRTHELARRPMHFDEANQAVKLGELLDAGRYTFDPHDHHGPTLYYAALPIAWVRGETSLATLTETTVRLVPAIFGTVSVVLLALFAMSWSGLAGQNGAPGGWNWPALAAAGFLAVSPPAVYYSRYFIQETLLVTFTLGAFLGARTWWINRRVSWAVATGVCVGLMQATKATAPLFIVAAIVALSIARSCERERVDHNNANREPTRPRSQLRKPLLAAALAAIVTAALLFSSFGTNLSGLRDAVTVYAHALTRFGASAEATGHEKPWWYFLRMLGRYREGGLVWHQLAFSALALAGLVVAFFSSLSRAGRGTGDRLKWHRLPAGDSQSPASRLLQWAAGYTVIVIGAYSFFSYKTPWHAVHFVPGMALLAAGALAALAHGRSSFAPPSGGGMVRVIRKIAAAGLLCVVIATLASQTRLVAYLRPADQRNPYAYVHSSPDVLKYRALAEAAVARAPDQPVRVISEEYWPLPWYLRGLPHVGFSFVPPDDSDGALVIASATQADAVRARLRGRYRESILGLRPGFICIVFTPEERDEDVRE